MHCTKRFSEIAFPIVLCVTPFQFSFAYSCRIDELRVREVREELQMTPTQPPTMPQTTPTKGTDQTTLGADPTTQDGE